MNVAGTHFIAFRDLRSNCSKCSSRGFGIKIRWTRPKKQDVFVCYACLLDYFDAKPTPELDQMPAEAPMKKPARSKCLTPQK